VPCRPDDVLKLRMEKERGSLQGFKNGAMKQYRSLPELHDFIYFKHGAYAASRHDPAITRATLPKKLRDSY
jgi:hypothetical protein